MSADAASDSVEPLRFWQRLALGLAGAVLLLGIGAEASGAALFTTFALDGYAALVWGVVYGVLALMVGRRYKRVLIAVAGLLLVDGTRLVITAGDADDAPCATTRRKPTKRSEGRSPHTS